MSSSLGTLVIASGTRATFSAPNNGVKSILIGNESGLTVTITMESGGVQKTLYPSTVDWFTVKPGFSGNIIVTPQTILNNASTFPASSLIFDAIGLNDSEEAFMYPISLSRNTNIGNNLTVSAGSSTSVTNDNQPLTPSNVFVEATPTGVGSSTVSIATDGTVTIKGDVSNVLTTLLQLLPAASAGASSVQLADANRRTEVLGTLLVDKASSLDNGTLTTDGSGNITKWTGTLQVSGTVPALSVGSSKTRVQAPTGGSVNIQIPAASDVLVASSTGVTVTGTSTLDSGAITTDGSGNITKWAGVLQVDGSNPALSVGSNKTRVQAANTGSINLQVPGGSDVAVVTNGAFTVSQQLTLSGVGITWKTNDTISGTHTFTGTTTGTYTHGAGGTPFIVIPMCDVVGSQTMGYDTITSTQVHITSGGGLGFKALTILG
jgi:hypothetical protein